MQYHGCNKADMRGFLIFVKRGKNMNRAETILEFDKVRNLWSSFALTDAAKEKIAQITPYMSESDLSGALRETTEAREIIEKGGNPPLTSLEGLWRQKKETV